MRFELDTETVVRRFLQTAVILDDEAYIAEPDHSAEATLGDQVLDEGFEAVVPHIEPELQDAENRQAVALEELAGPKALFTEAVVEGFADFGIVCSVLRPTAPEGSRNDHRRLTTLARRSDIVVLDWQLTGPDLMQDRDGPRRSDGTSIDFLRELLVADSKVAPRHRLVCIYTGDPKLEDIFARIKKELPDLSGDIGQGETKSFVLTSRTTRVVLVAKKRQESRSDVEAVTAAELPTLMVAQFQELLSTGLLSDVALSSLSSIRDGAHQLLHRFNAEMDPGLFSHYARTGPDATADFLLGLLGDELKAIVHSSELLGLLDPLKVEQRVASILAISGPKYLIASKKNGTAPHEVSLEEANLILKRASTKKFKTPSSHTEVDPPSLTSLLLPGDSQMWPSVKDSALEIDKRLGVLSCMARTTATLGTAEPPSMHLGTILREGPNVLPPRGSASGQPSAGAYSYFLCLQPVCDSVRLTSTTAFPLLPLRANHSSTDLIVDYRGEMLFLSATGVKFHRLQMVLFEPDAESHTVKARRTTREDGSWVIASKQGTEYEWVGQVRQWKAQKLVGTVASSASRIGLDEYEYLRILGPDAS